MSVQIFKCDKHENHFPNHCLQCEMEKAKSGKSNWYNEDSTLNPLNCLGKTLTN
jgi:hypothetical protein